MPAVAAKEAVASATEGQTNLLKNALAAHSKTGTTNRRIQVRVEQAFMPAVTAKEAVASAAEGPTN
ncbi:MAG TPA: hypothetical protein VF532_03230 [Candidatus Angelobacter sp.]